MHRKLALSALMLVMLVSYAFSQAEAPDPTRLTCGARLLGMGRAFVGLSDDVNSIFMNPAGIANLNRWQVTSMSGKLLDFNYITFSGVYPTNFGNIGLGVSSSNIGGAYGSKVVDGTQGTADPIYELDYTEQFSYSNSVYILSYGNQMGKVLEIPQLGGLKNTLSLFKDLKFGANLKIFSAGLSGGSISNGSATGQEIDLGLLQQFQPWLGVGLQMKNVLPFSMGGKLSYAAQQHEESYPMSVRLGTSINLLGKRNALREFGQDARLLIDMENFPTRTGYPWVFHVGLEWMPIQLLTLRAGIDQDAAEGSSGQIEAISNFTAGVSLSYQMIRFDYGYHQFAGIVGEDNHFFSLTYGIPLEEVKRDFITVTSPPDKKVTMEATAQVAGTAEKEVKYVYANGVWLPLSAKGEFGKAVGLKFAKNRITIEAQDVQKKPLEYEWRRMCRLRTFPDVPRNSWAAEQIGFIATMGIIEGYPNGTFKPTGNITRAELTTVLMRTRKVEPQATTSFFNDVALTMWAAKYIMPAVKLGVVKGYPNGTFKPNANVTRAEGLAMIARFSNVTQEAGTTPYADVPASHWAAPIVKGSYRAGMLQYLGSKPFEPNRKLTREEAVEMLFRSPYVQDLLRRDLLNWDTY